MVGRQSAINAAEAPCNPTIKGPAHLQQAPASPHPDPLCVICPGVRYLKYLLYTLRCTFKAGST